MRPTPIHLNRLTSPEQVDEIVAGRAAIEQAKGVLMFVYGIDSHHAFELLRSRARTTRVKLRLLAEQLIVDVLGLTLDERRDMPVSVHQPAAHRAQAGPT
jgi:ANTAR domain